jgi:hypothetical protein
MGNRLNWIRVADYNQSTNVKRIIGTLENPIRLWKLMSGLYLLSGFVQYNDIRIAEYCENEDLFVSVTTELQDENHIVSCFIPFWEAQYDYLMTSFDSEEFEEHQVTKMLMEGDVKVPSKLSELENDIFAFDEEGNLIVTINGISKKFIPYE